jgi:DNA-binding NtrC family response regulator
MGCTVLTSIENTDTRKRGVMSNILIVDDQPYVRELLSEILTHEGYQVASVGDVQSMWRHLRDSPPDLVLLDLYLNGSKGWDVLRDIKSIDPNLPVLIVTGYDSYVNDPRLSQAAGYIIKSISAFDELKEKIAEVLKNGSPR